MLGAFAFTGAGDGGNAPGGFGYGGQTDATAGGGALTDYWVLPGVGVDGYEWDFTGLASWDPATPAGIVFADLSDEGATATLDAGNLANFDADFPRPCIFEATLTFQDNNLPDGTEVALVADPNASHIAPLGGMQFVGANGQATAVFFAGAAGGFSINGGLNDCKLTDVSIPVAGVDTRPHVRQADSYAQTTPTHTIYIDRDLSSYDLIVGIVTVAGVTGSITETSTSNWTVSATTTSTNVKSAVISLSNPGASEDLALAFGESALWVVTVFFIRGADTLVVSSPTTGSGTSMDPPSLDAGAVRDHVFIAAGAFRSADAPSGYPAGYAAFMPGVELFNGGGAGARATLIAKRANGQVENPSAFTIQSSNWVAYTLAAYKA